MINKACEHTSTWAFKHPSTHTSYYQITLGFKHDHKKHLSARESNYISVLAYKHIDISSFKYVHMWLKNKSCEGVTLNLSARI